jgi:vanillate O-demethylase ferredoxin subunit
MRFARNWSHCIVHDIRDVAASIREFTLVPQDGAFDKFAPGSHIEVGVIIDGQPQTRSYSLVGRPDAGQVRIAVRLAPDSRGGSRYMWSLKQGARLEVSSPASLFDIDWARRDFCLIAGGIGITPMVGIAAALKRRGANAPLHYCVTSRAAAAYLDDLDAMLGHDLIVHASDEGQRLDLDALFAALPDGAMAVVCGPMRLLEAARHAWAAAGRPATDLRYETFGSSGLLPTVEFRVRVKGSGEEIVIPPNRSMLDALNAAGHEVMSDCERGECGVCAIDVVDVDGAIDHRDVFFSDHEKQASRKICPCVSRAQGVVTVDTLYQPDAV